MMSLWEMAGGRLVVTPTVADELPGNVRQSEGRYWEDVLSYEIEKKNARYSTDAYQRIIRGTKDAAGRWITAELSGSGGGGITAAELDPETARRARWIELTIPASCFRRPDQANQRRDARIIGEAAALGFTLLATENLGTIKEERTNEWLLDQGFANEPMIMTVAEAAEALHPQSTREAATLQAVLGAALPDTDQGIARDLRAITQFIARLTEGHAKTCAVWATDGLEGVDNPGDLIRSVRARLPMHTRATEASRVAQTRKAAQHAGFGGFST